jgi:hypothetical protein
MISTPTPGHDLDNFIRGIDDLPHRRRELQERNEPFPGVPPDPNRGRILLAPVRALEDVQFLSRGRFSGGGVDRPQRRGHGLAVVVGNEPHRRPDQMHHTGLNHGLRPGRLDRLREAGQPVAAGDQHLLHAPVAELSQHPGPKLRALRRLHPNPQHMLDPIGVDSNSDVGSLVADGVGLLDLHHQSVEVDDRIHPSNSLACQALTSSSTASVMLEIVSCDSSVPNVRSRWA